MLPCHQSPNYAQSALVLFGTQLNGARELLLSSMMRSTHTLNWPGMNTSENVIRKQMTLMTGEEEGAAGESRMPRPPRQHNPPIMLRRTQYRWYNMVHTQFLAWSSMATQSKAMLRKYRVTPPHLSLNQQASCWYSFLVHLTPVSSRYNVHQAQYFCGMYLTDYI